MSDLRCWRCGKSTSLGIRSVDDSGTVFYRCSECGNDVDNMYDFDAAKDEIFRLRAEVDRLKAEIADNLPPKVTAIVKDGDRCICPGCHAEILVMCTSCGKAIDRTAWGDDFRIIDGSTVCRACWEKP